jgi:hypothetical protein
MTGPTTKAAAATEGPTTQPPQAGPESVNIDRDGHGEGQPHESEARVAELSSVEEGRDHGSRAEQRQ